MRFVLRPLLFTITAWPLLGCGGGQGAADAGSDAGGVTDGAASDLDDDGALGTCEGDPRADTYAPGIEKTGAAGLLKTRIVDAMPAPPRKRTNNWTLQVVDAAGTPIDGATVTLSLFMPDHGHGGTVMPTIEPAGAEGRYALKNVYLFMGGLWEITIDVTLPGGATDQVIYRFCITS